MMTQSFLLLTSDQLIRAYQIHDYLEASGLTLKNSNIKNVIQSIVIESFKPAALRTTPSTTTARLTRNSSAKLSSYLVD